MARYDMLVLSLCEPLRNVCPGLYCLNNEEDEEDEEAEIDLEVAKTLRMRWT